MTRATTINELIDQEHVQGATSFVGTADGLVALRTKREGELWHYYRWDVRKRGYVLTGTTERLEA